MNVNEAWDEAIARYRSKCQVIEPERLLCACGGGGCDTCNPELVARLLPEDDEYGIAWIPEEEFFERLPQLKDWLYWVIRVWPGMLRQARELCGTTV